MAEVKAERNTEIYARHVGGCAQWELAAIYGLDKSTICNIIARYDDGPAADRRRAAMRAAQHRRWVKNATRLNDDQRDRKYGLATGEYDALLAKQGGVCAICGKAETKIRLGSVLRLHVDHDHGTGEVRGILCAACNVGLGSFFDDTTALRRAIAYLERGGQ